MESSIATEQYFEARVENSQRSWLTASQIAVEKSERQKAKRNDNEEDLKRSGAGIKHQNLERFLQAIRVSNFICLIYSVQDSKCSCR